MDGKDAATGAACADDDTDPAAGPQGGAAEEAEDADPSAPMAVPEHNVPDEVSGCQQAEEEEDD